MRARLSSVLLATLLLLSAAASFASQTIPEVHTNEKPAAAAPTVAVSLWLTANAFPS